MPSPHPSMPQNRGISNPLLPLPPLTTPPYTLPCHPLPAASFGVSNSGKTYTLLGSHSSPGLLPRIVAGLFAAPSEGVGAAVGREVEVSVLEVYNEGVYDLLSGGVGGGEEDKDRDEHDKNKGRRERGSNANAAGKVRGYDRGVCGGEGSFSLPLSLCVFFLARRG